MTWIHALISPLMLTHHYGHISISAFLYLITGVLCRVLLQLWQWTNTSTQIRWIWKRQTEIGEGWKCMCGEICAVRAYVRAGRPRAGDWLSSSGFMQPSLESPRLPPGTPLYLCQSSLCCLHRFLLMTLMRAGSGQSPQRSCPTHLSGQQNAGNMKDVWAKVISLRSSSHHFSQTVSPQQLPGTYSQRASI